MENLGPLQIVGSLLIVAAALVGVGVLGARLSRRLPPMLPIPIQSMFMYCTLFTVGVALMSTRASSLVPFGIVFTFVGLAIFLPERLAARCLGLFLMLLVISLATVLQQLRKDGPLFQPQRLSLLSAAAFAFVWGAGILFAWQRWQACRVEKTDARLR